MIKDTINVILKAEYKENMTQGLIGAQNLKEILTNHGLGDAWIFCLNNSKGPSYQRQLIDFISKSIIDMSVQNTMLT